MASGLGGLALQNGKLVLDLELFLLDSGDLLGACRGALQKLRELILECRVTRAFSASIRPVMSPMS
nr:hypothetical protein [Paracoccus sp. AK26]